MQHKILSLKDFYPKLGENECDAKIELYLPDIMEEMGWHGKKRPCIIVCPGGGYGYISSREGEPIALNFLKEGYNAFVVTYSVAPHRFPQQLLEIAAVLELIYKNAEEWNCDVTKVAIAGFSAGGHLAAHYSNAYDCKEVRELFPNSKPVQATILAYPVITSNMTFAHKRSFENLLGYFPNDSEIRFSCENIVGENTPPAFLWHTAADDCVPVENSFLYASSLSRYKIPFELHIYPFGWHGLSTVDEQTCEKDWLDARVGRSNEWMEAAKKWLENVL